MNESIAIINAEGKIVKRKDAILPIYSITKTMIASLILDLKIDLESRISKWIPDAICKHSKKIKVLQLLNHSSGIKDYGSLPDYKNDVENRKQPWSDEEFIEKTVNTKLLFEPGNGFAYSNPNYWLLKRILEIESGSLLDELIEKHIANPLNLSSLKIVHGVFDESPNGYQAEWVWHGLATSNAADVASFMTSDKVRRLNSHLNKVDYRDEYWQNPYYGLGIMVEREIKFGHLGGGPGYEAACIKFLDSNICACAIVPTSQNIHPLKRLLLEMEKN